MHRTQRASMLAGCPAITTDEQPGKEERRTVNLRMSLFSLDHQVSVSPNEGWQALCSGERLRALRAAHAGLQIGVSQQTQLPFAAGTYAHYRRRIYEEHLIQAAGFHSHPPVHIKTARLYGDAQFKTCAICLRALRPASIMGVIETATASEKEEPVVGP